MLVLRRIILALLTPILPILLFATAFDVGVIRIIGQPSSVKKILADSGIYNTVVPAALDQAKNISSDGATVSLTDTDVKQVANSTFTPQFIQQQTEKAIDGTYDWLNGKTPQPDFNIDLTQAKANFAYNVGQAVVTRMNSLPACPKGAAPVSPDSFDAFSATCVPAGLNVQTVATTVQNEIVSGQGFLDHPNITAASVKNANSNQSVFQGQLKKAPSIYQKAKKAPVILVALTVLIMAAIVFLSSSISKGLRHVGFTLLSIGIVMILFAFLLNNVVDHKVLPNIKVDNAVLKADLQKLVQDIANSIDDNYKLFGGIYAALGVLAIGVPMLMGRGGAPRPAPAAATSHAAAASGDTPPQAANGAPYIKRETPRPQRPPVRPPKIQG